MRPAAGVNPPPFRRGALIAIASLVGLSFMVWIGSEIYGPHGTPDPRFEPEAYGVSAVGYRALLETLSELGVPARVSHYGSRLERGLLVVSDPDLDDASLERLAEAVRVSRHVLVVLPKWRVSPASSNESWIEAAVPRSPAAVERVLEAAGVEGSVVRLVAGGELEWTAPEGWPEPDLLEPQLLRESDLEPLVATSRGTLLGTLRAGERRVSVLADPDLFANHGLGRGDNAAFAAALLDGLRDGGDVVFDETVHGRFDPPTIWQRLGRFPLVMLLAQLVLGGAFVVWAGAGRFGAPEPKPPALAQGKAFLVDNVADLMRQSGPDPAVLRRYLDDRAREVAARLHAPPRLAGDALWSWLDQRTRPAGSLAALRREVAELSQGARRASARTIIRAAHAVFRWAEEAVHGSVRDPARR